MTIGSWTKKDQVPTTAYDSDGVGFTIWVGKKHSRSWSGSDYPSTKPAKPFSFHREPGLWAPARPPKRTRTEEHDYTMTYSVISNALVTVKNRYSSYTGPGDFESTCGTLGPWQTPWSSNDDIALLSKLRNKVAGSDFNAGVFLGEGKESLKLIADSATRVYRGIKAAKRLDFAGIYSALFQPSQTRRFKNYREQGWLDDERFLHWERKRWDRKAVNSAPSDRDSSSLWLEFSYGWLPLLQDVKGAAEFLSQQLETPLQTVVRVTRQVSSKGINSSSPTWYKYASSGVTAQKWYKVTISEIDTVGLSGLTDPLSVAWELVPFSFVLDWFIPVGNFLSARGLTQSLTGSMVVSTLTRAYGIGVVTLPTAGWIALNSAGSTERVTFTRQVNQPIGSTLKLPSMKPLGSVPSWMRAANALSLLDQLRPR